MGRRPVRSTCPTRTPQHFTCFGTANKPIVVLPRWVDRTLGEQLGRGIEQDDGRMFLETLDTRQTVELVYRLPIFQS